MSEGIAKKGGKNVVEKAEAGIAEALTLQSVGPSLEPKFKLKNDHLHTRIANQGKSLVPTAAPNGKRTRSPCLAMRV